MIKNAWTRRPPTSFDIKSYDGVIGYKPKKVTLLQFINRVASVPSPLSRIIMTIIVVYKTKRVVVILGGEAEGVVAGAGTGEGGGAKGGVVDVGDGGVGRADGDDIGDILIAIVHQEGGGFAILPEGERARKDGLGGVPDELLVDIPRAVGEELLDAEIAVVEEDGVSDLRGAIHLAVGDAAAVVA